MTAIEFLHSEYKRIFGELNPSTAQLYEIAYALEQAKEMEYKQIIDARAITKTGYEIAEAEEYYFETYGSIHNTN